MQVYYSRNTVWDGYADTDAFQLLKLLHDIRLNNLNTEIHMQYLLHSDGCCRTETHTSTELVWLIHQQVYLSGCGFRKIVSLKILIQKERDKGHKRTQCKNEDTRQ